MSVTDEQARKLNDLLERVEAEGDREKVQEIIAALIAYLDELETRHTINPARRVA